MQNLVYVLIGIAAYTAIVYISIKEPKAIVIGLIEMAVLLAILLILKFSSDLIYRTPGYNSTLGLVGLVGAVILKMWLAPVYRLKNGFVYKDKAYRKDHYPAADITGYDVTLYSDSKRSKKSRAHQLVLTGPLKDRSRRTIQSLYSS